MNLRRDTEKLGSAVMFHLVPFEIDVNNLQPDETIETLSPPLMLHTSAYAMKLKILMLHTSAYAMKLKISSSTARKRHIRKFVTSLQCARIMRTTDEKPCNGKILVVDKVSGIT